MTKEQIINSLIKDSGYSSYLEIGYGDGHCFKQINCDDKVSVDPASSGASFKGTSDEFFGQNDRKWDVIFIDGLHEAAQVRKDIVNAAKCLTDHGAIILHDIAPETEAMQVVPRQQREWTGDVWRAWDGFRKKYPDVRTEEHPVKYGLGVIFPEGKKVKAHFEDMETAWHER